MASLTPCKKEISSFYDCLLRQPLQNWECALDGVAAIRDGLCNAQQEESLRCMEAKMAP
jgi:hypothetical protein